MTSRLRLLGIALVIGGLLFIGAGGFTFVKAQEGIDSLKAFSAAQNVQLSYDDKGVLNGDDPEEAAGIMALLADDWKYPVVTSELDPNDPIVNTASEYMYQMATISYHVFGRADPIEAAARGQAWSPTALGLIGELGVGTTTASALQLALAIAGLLAGIGLAVIFTGLGLVWVSAARLPLPAESVSTAPVTGTGAVPAPVTR
jgi:hypothetical protein